MKRFTPFAIFFAIAALVIGLVAPSSAASTVAQGFLATSPGPTAALAFSGQLQCEVAVNAPGTLAATPQYSSDGVTWVPATVIGNGSINQPGVYIGTNPIAAGYGFLRLNISSFSGSQLSGQLACGDNLPPANSGGTGAVSSVNGGACITVSPITGDTIVTYTCATPVPLTVSTPLVLTTPGNDSINIACPGCGGGGGGSSPSTYDQMIEGDAPLAPANYWPLSDASGVPVDAALGLTLTAVGTVTYHSASLLNNGDLSMTFPSTGNFFELAASGNAALGFGNAGTPFTFECWFKFPTLPGANSFFFGNMNSGATNGLLFFLNSSNHVSLYTGSSGSTYDTGFAPTAATPYYLVYEYDGSYSYLFVNGSLVYNAQTPGTVVATDTNAAVVFTLGGQFGASNGGNGITMQKAAFYSGVMPLTEITRHYTAGTTSVYKWPWN